MKQIDDFKYYVIQFLDPPYDIDDYVCVPWSWIKLHRTDGKIEVAYPIEDPYETEQRVKDHQESSKEWGIYLAELKFGTNCYDDAKEFAKEKIAYFNYEKESANRTNVHESSMHRFEKKKRKPIRKYKPRKKKNAPHEAATSSKDDYQPPIKITLKRSSTSTSGLEVDTKRPKMVKPNHSDTDSSEDNQPLNLINKKQSQKSSQTNLNNDKQDRYTVTKSTSNLKLPMLETQAGIGQVFDHSFFEILRDLHSRSIVLTKSIEQIFENLQKTLSSPSSSDEANDENGDENNVGDVVSKRRARKFVLPPEYDANDSRWTLKYREPGPGLVELIPNTGVYINKVRLVNCQLLSQDRKTLARKLAVEIFSKNALSICSLTGARANMFGSEVVQVRPGLDENARSVILSFVEEYGQKMGWGPMDTQAILSTLRSKLQEMRGKHG